MSGGPVVLNALGLSHEAIRKVVRPGDLVVDATAGNGHDTLFLAGLVGPGGLVLAFDVQEEAAARTRARLEAAGLLDRCRVYAEGHERLESRLAERGPDARIAAAMFNLGWLPGGDHAVGTRTETTLSALRQAMDWLRTGGIVTVAVYYGRESGYEERDAVLRFAAAADVREWAVQRTEMANATNDAPVFLCFERLESRMRRPTDPQGRKAAKARKEPTG